MSLKTWIAGLFGEKPPAYRKVGVVKRRFLMTSTCLDAVTAALESSRERRHEGVAHLLGLTDGAVTLAACCLKSDAVTTAGSFRVEERAMAGVVRRAADLGLQVVGQVHTHPGRAYHSEGDNAGARNRYAGFCSLVIPDYGSRLPSLDGSAPYFFVPESGFQEVEVEVVSEDAG